MKGNQLKTGSFLSYLQIALNVIIGLIYTPIKIRLLGDSEFGLYNTVASTISMLSILSLGFNAGYVRYYSRYKKNNEQEKINSLNGMILLIFIIIGVVAFLCGAFFTFNLRLVFDSGLTENEYEIARVLMALMTFNLAISFPMSVFSCIITVHEKFLFIKSLGILKTVVGPLVTLPLLLLGYRSIAMVGVTIGVALFTDACYLFYVLGKLKCKFVFKNFEKGLFKEMFVYTFFIALNTIVSQINLNVDKFLLGRFKGTVSVAIYSIGFMLYGYFEMFSTSISSVFIPRIHRMVSVAKDEQEKKKLLTELFVKVGRIQYLILMLIVTGLIFFGYDFIVRYWAGEIYSDSFIVALLLIVPSTVPLIQSVGIEMQRAQNRHQFRSIVYFCMAILNLTVSIFLCQLWGAIGASIGTAIAAVLANGIIMNVYYHKRCNVDILCFWKNILKMSLGLIIPIAFGIGMVLLLDFSNIAIFILSIFVYICIYSASTWFFSMNSYERNLIKNPLSKIFKRLKRG